MGRPRDSNELYEAKMGVRKANRAESEAYGVRERQMLHDYLASIGLDPAQFNKRQQREIVRQGLLVMAEKLKRKELRKEKKRRKEERRQRREEKTRQSKMVLAAERVLDLINNGQNFDCSETAVDGEEEEEQVDDDDDDNDDDNGTIAGDLVYDEADGVNTVEEEEEDDANNGANAVEEEQEDADTKKIGGHEIADDDGREDGEISSCCSDDDDDQDERQVDANDADGNGPCADADHDNVSNEEANVHAEEEDNNVHDDATDEEDDDDVDANVEPHGFADHNSTRGGTTDDVADEAICGDGRGHQIDDEVHPRQQQPLFAAADEIVERYLHVQSEIQARHGITINNAKSGHLIDDGTSTNDSSNTFEEEEERLIGRHWQKKSHPKKPTFLVPTAFPSRQKFVTKRGPIPTVVVAKGGQKQAKGPKPPAIGIGQKFSSSFSSSWVNVVVGIGKNENLLNSQQKMGAKAQEHQYHHHSQMVVGENSAGTNGNAKNGQHVMAVEEEEEEHSLWPPPRKRIAHVAKWPQNNDVEDGGGTSAPAVAGTSMAKGQRTIDVSPSPSEKENSTTADRGHGHDALLGPKKSCKRI